MNSLDPAEFYTGVVPSVYTALRGSHYSAERYLQFVKTAGSPALELGCGDAGPFYDLVRAGVDVEGVDSSLDMVRRGRDRLAQENLVAKIHHDRMETLHLGRRFRSVYLAGPTFNLLPDDHRAMLALRTIARHLHAEGAALVPLWVPAPTPSGQFGTTRESSDGSTRMRYTVLSEEYDAARRVRTTSVRYELHTGGRSIVQDRNWIIHWYERADFEQLAQEAGLTVRWEPTDGELIEATLTHS